MKFIQVLGYPKLKIVKRGIEIQGTQVKYAKVKVDNPESQEELLEKNQEK
jgi:hypothetical protein